MNSKKLLCAALSLTLLFAAGCGRKNVTKSPQETTAITYEEVTASLGESATYGGMTLTVLAAQDPDITMDSGKKAMFFEVRIDNGSQDTVEANWLNNFTLSVDSQYFEADECCTIPVRKELYDYYGFDALTEELAPGETCSGYIACEVPKNYSVIELHYIPKTTDRASRITVPLSGSDIVKIYPKTN